MRDAFLGARRCFYFLFCNDEQSFPILYVTIFCISLSGFETLNFVRIVMEIVYILPVMVKFVGSGTLVWEIEG